MAESQNIFLKILRALQKLEEKDRRWTNLYNYGKKLQKMQKKAVKGKKRKTQKTLTLHEAESQGENAYKVDFEKKSKKMPHEKISDYLFGLYKKEYLDEYEKFIENTEISKDEKINWRHLVEAQVALQALHKDMWPISLGESDIDDYIRDFLKPNVKKIADSNSSALSLAAKDAFDALNIAHLEKEKRSVNSSSDSKRVGIALTSIILLFIANSIYNSTRSVFIALLIPGCILIFVVYIAKSVYKKHRKELEESLEKAKQALIRFLNVNLLDLEKSYPSEGEFKISSEEIKPVNFIPEQTSMAIDWYEPKLDPHLEKAIESVESTLEQARKDSASNITGNVRGNSTDDYLPPEALQVSQQGEVGSEEKKEYVMYSQDYRDGKPISEKAYLSEREEYANDLRNYVFIIDAPDDIFFFNGKLIDNVKSEAKQFLKVILKKRDHKATYIEIFNAVKNEGHEDLDKSDKNSVQSWKSALKGSLGDDLLLYLKNLPREGYRLALGIDSKYCVLDYFSE
ncbi:MAG: hypothetical protein PVH61_00120 [Candidatus Aminicenantes bacterium]|jgi:hypothetical protein